MTLIDRHALADALRDLAVDLDSGNVPQPDDPPRSLKAENVRGFDLLFRQYPDGRTTIATRETGTTYSWGPEVELQVSA